jgi:Tol biopolymer transport system component
VSRKRPPPRLSAAAPDGSKIAFTSWRSGRPQIYTMNSSTGGNLTRITQTTTGELGPALSH